MKYNEIQKYYKIEFIQWFVGFSDAECIFSIQPVLNSNNEIQKITWLYKIELHKDDVNVLEYIKNTLEIGKVNVNNNKCVFTITNTEGILKLISIFYYFPLNSSKYLDFIYFKKAFKLYLEKDDSLSKKELADRIVELKNSMNTKRTNTILPEEHNITLTKSWLLGFIEGDGSFFISRTDIEPVFSLTSSEEQLPLFLKIREYLENNLGLDKYSLFKLQSTKSISLTNVKAREIGKPSIMLSIKNLKLLQNYFIPFFDNAEFKTKKELDFLDFKLITNAVYKGSHNIPEIRSLILKLSHTMNNYRLSTFTGCKQLINNSEKKSNNKCRTYNRISKSRTCVK